MDVTPQKKGAPLASKCPRTIGSGYPLEAMEEPRVHSDGVNVVEQKALER